jgi:hypothetical protein
VEGADDAGAGAEAGGHDLGGCDVASENFGEVGTDAVDQAGGAADAAAEDDPFRRQHRDEVGEA